MSIYDKKFYQNRHERTRYAAQTILSLIFDNYKINSVVDFGCGVGTWVDACKELGVTKALGIEGDWVNKSMTSSSFELHNADLQKPIRLDRKYDLAISLEVAEHIPEEKSDDFVDNLTNSSDIVLFSAAVVGQGGRGHVNEKMQSYWVEKFAKRGYVCMDIIRPEVWNDNGIDVWYKQNIFVFSRNQDDAFFSMPLDVIHPTLFNIYSNPSIYIILKNVLKIPALIIRKIFK